MFFTPRKYKATLTSNIGVDVMESEVFTALTFEMAYKVTEAWLKLLFPECCEDDLPYRIYKIVEV